MIIIQDTREQKPLKFNHPWITEVRIEKIDIGDYRAEFTDGYKPPIVFERKSIGDLYGTMGYGYGRFKRCIVRAQDSETTLFIIVEGSLTKVLKGYEHSKIGGISMVYKLFTLWVRYGVQTIFVNNRVEMVEFITHFYLSCGKDYVRRKKLDS